MRKTEILAPAGSYASMKAAVNAGCDAVYIGGSRFGARAFADNLTEEDLKRAIDFVHLREKKLYLTVNTLLKEEELKEQLYNYLLPFYEQGLDAVIVQDLGVMSFLHRNFPRLPIHASTQMTLTGSRGANGLKEFGVTRFVPARELSLKEIQKIRKETDLEIETFVHGALCYCYSGQCLLSSVIGGRSGNRGRCAQPCRMQYRLEDGKTGYFMSPKDICTLDMVPELIEAGIDSFKIEGRMKRPAYAAYTAYLYGKYTDLYENLGKEGYADWMQKNSQEFKEDKTALMDLYNRGGFSSGYYKQYHGKTMMSVKRPNHSGVRVGEVTRAGKRKVSVRLCEEVYGQDILEFRDNRENAVYEYTLKTGAKKGSEITANILPGSKIYPGMEVFRTKNQSLLGQIEASYLEREEPVKLTGLLEAVAGEPAALSFTYQPEAGKEITVRVLGDCVEKAQNQPMTEEKLKKAVQQMQNSGFVLEELSTKIQGEVFLPVGKLKQLRREGLKQITEAILLPHKRNITKDRFEIAAGQPEKNSGRTAKPALDAFVLTKEQAEAVLSLDAGQAEGGIDRIYLSGELYRECRKAGLVFAGKEVIFTLPYVVREKNRERVLREISEAADNVNTGQSPEVQGFLVRNLEEFFALTEAGTLKEPKKRILDSNMYTLNREAEKTYLALGAAETTASLELNKRELSLAGCEDKTLLVYGHIPLMITAQCMIDNVYGCTKKEGFQKFYDRKGKLLYLRNCCADCYNMIYDGTPISLLGEKEAVKELSPKRLRLDFTIEGKEETKEILKTFLEVFRYDKEGKILEKDTTRGHFFKGID